MSSTDRSTPYAATRTPLARRHFLKGLGAAVALPVLDAMAPSVFARAAAAAAKPPVRMGFFFVPNGVHMPDWTPAATGADFELPFILRPLAPLRRQLTVISGLTHDKGRANGDGPGDHARCAGVFLTGAQPLKSEGSEIRAGISADQLAAKEIGGATRFPSIEVGTEGGRPLGKCDSGYSCAYSNNISWKDETTPVAKMVDPRQVFERLFASDLPTEAEEGRARRLAQRRSILDFVRDDARALARQVGYADAQKLDEYLTAVREIERRIEGSENANSRSATASILAGYNRPAGIPPEVGEHIRLLGDMVVLAYQADVTRISTFMFANAGSNRSYRQVGVREGHHSLSHHQNDPVKHRKIKEINRFHVTQLAYILGRMESIKEGEGTLLDHSLIVYGSGISDGNRHNNENLPILLAGRGGGSVLSGRHIKFDMETPMSNLLLSVIQRGGVKAEGFGDSTGPLRGLGA